MCIIHLCLLNVQHSRYFADINRTYYFQPSALLILVFSSIKKSLCFFSMIFVFCQILVVIPIDVSSQLDRFATALFTFFLLTFNFTIHYYQCIPLFTIFPFLLLTCYPLSPLQPSCLSCFTAQCTITHSSSYCIGLAPLLLHL